MLQKINTLLQIKEQLDSLKADMGKQTEAFIALEQEHKILAEGIGATKKSMLSIKSEQSQHLLALRGSLNDINALKKELQAEVADFKVMRTKINKDIITQLSKEFKEDLKLQFEKLKTDTDQFNDVKSDLAKVAEDVKTCSSELSKFSKIAENIKEADFDLQKHAKNLQQANNEKMELMRKIDSLERLVSKMRRSR